MVQHHRARAIDGRFLVRGLALTRPLMELPLLDCCLRRAHCSPGSVRVDDTGRVHTVTSPGIGHLLCGRHFNAARLEDGRLAIVAPNALEGVDDLAFGGMDARGAEEIRHEVLVSACRRDADLAQSGLNRGGVPARAYSI